MKGPEQNAKNEIEKNKLPSYRALRAHNRERLRHAGEEARRRLSSTGKEAQPSSTKGRGAAAGSTGCSTVSGSATKPATSDELLSSEDYEVRVVNSLGSTSSDGDKIGSSAAIAEKAAEQTAKEAADGKDGNDHEKSQENYRIPRKPESSSRFPRASNAFHSPATRSLSTSLEKKEKPKQPANPNTPEALAEMQRQTDEMHERRREADMRHNAQLREKMAKNAPALAEKRRRRAIRNAWKREDHCNFNSEKMAERKSLGSDEQPSDGTQEAGGRARTLRAAGRIGENALQGHSRDGGWPKPATQHGSARRSTHNENSPRRGLPQLRSLPLPTPSRLQDAGPLRPSRPQERNRDLRTPPRNGVPMLRREGPSFYPCHNRARFPNSDFRVPRSPVREGFHRNVVPYSRPRHVDEGGRGVPHGELAPRDILRRDDAQDTVGRGVPPRNDYRNPLRNGELPHWPRERPVEDFRRAATPPSGDPRSSRVRDYRHDTRYERYSPRRNSPGRTPPRRNPEVYGAEGRGSYERARKMERDRREYLDGEGQVGRGLEKAERTPGDERNAGFGGKRSWKHGRKSRKVFHEDSDSYSGNSSVASSSSDEEDLAVVRGKRKRQKSKRFSLADVQDLMRLVQEGQTSGSKSKQPKPKRRRKKSFRQLPSAGRHLSSSREGPSRGANPKPIALVSSRAMHKIYRTSKEPRPLGDIRKLEKRGRLREGRGGRRFAEAIEQQRDEDRENCTESEFKIARDVMADVMHNRGKKLDGVAEEVVGQFSMPSWYRGRQPVQDIVNIFADLGNDGFITFIHKVLEMDYKACHVWERDLHLLAMKFRELGMFHFERVCQEIDSLLREHDVERAMVLGRACRLQLTCVLELLETPSMYRYFAKLSTFDAVNMARRNNN